MASSLSHEQASLLLTNPTQAWRHYDRFQIIATPTHERTLGRGGLLHLEPCPRQLR
jgi:hypothetical protein